MPPDQNQNEDQKKQPGISRQLDQLQRAIERFRIDAQRFFAGDLGVPPEPLRDEIQARLRELRASNLKAAADSFRLNSLEARFHSHLDLFGRRLREAEEGASARRAAEETKPDAEQGVTLGERSEPGAVEALYKGLYLGSKKSPKMDLERFRSYLGQQVETIRNKTGCNDIQFRVVDDEGKLKLKARPVRRK